MDEQQTCGKGIAQHSALTASLGELVASTARVLEVHMKALDLTDENSKREYDAYRELASAHRRIAIELADTAHRMAGYRDAANGPPRHGRDDVHPRRVTPSPASSSTRRHCVSLLQTRLTQDHAMLQMMESASNG